METLAPSSFQAGTPLSLSIFCPAGTKRLEKINIPVRFLHRRSLSMSWMLVVDGLVFEASPFWTSRAELQLLDR